MKDVYKPTKIVEPDEDMKKLVSWRNSLALDDWGDGLSEIIKYKLRGERDFENSRIPENLKETYERFMNMSDEDQYNIVYAVLGE
jgi:hypothetical protein